MVLRKQIGDLTMPPQSWSTHGDSQEESAVFLKTKWVMEAVSGTIPWNAEEKEDLAK